MKVTYEQCVMTSSLLHLLSVLRVVKYTMPGRWGIAGRLDDNTYYIRELYIK